MSLTLPCPYASDRESLKQFSVHICDHIRDVDAYHWQRFLPAENVLMQPPYLELIERTQGSRMQFKYVLIRQADNTVGALYFQIVPFEAGRLINYFPEGNWTVLRLMRNASEHILGMIKAQLLVSGNSFMTGENGFYFKPGIDAAMRGKLLRKAINEVCRADAAVSAVLIADLYDPRTAFDNGFLSGGYHNLTVESDMSIAIRPERKTFDDYLSALSSKYRVRARKVFAMCDENGVEARSLSADEIEQNSSRIFELYEKVMRRADFKLSMLTQDYFAAQKRLMPEAYHLIAYYRNNQMIGFISAFHTGRKVEVHYVGMDHEVCKPIHLYQHMMYDMVKLAIENGALHLHFGRTAPEIKSTIGAVPSAMYGYLKHRNPLVNFLLVKPYTANLRPRQYTMRNPFK